MTSPRSPCALLMWPTSSSGPLTPAAGSVDEVDVDPRRLQPGRVGADDLDEPSVARRTAVGRHHPVGRLLGLPHPHQAELHCHGLLSLLTPSSSSSPAGPACWSCRRSGIDGL